MLAEGALCTHSVDGDLGHSPHRDTDAASTSPTAEAASDANPSSCPSCAGSDGDPEADAHAGRWLPLVLVSSEGEARHLL